MIRFLSYSSIRKRRPGVVPLVQVATDTFIEKQSMGTFSGVLHSYEQRKAHTGH